MKVSRLLTFGPYCLDAERRVLLRDNQPIQLHQKALEILIILVQHRGEVVSKDDLMKAVWPDAFVEEANLTQNVFVLRKTLGEGSRENRYIATVPGRGYCFVAGVEDIWDREANVQSASQDATDSPLKNADRGRDGWLDWLVPSRRAWLLTLAVAGVLLTFAITRLFPRVARYFNNRGVLTEQAGDLKAAIGDFEWALRFSAGYAEAHYNLANAFEDIPDYDKALEQYQQAINLDPTLYPAYNNLARLYIMRREDYGAALRLLDRAMSLHPEELSVQYTIYKNYGWANLGLGQLGEAERYLSLAETLDSRRGSAHCLRAKLFEAMARKAEALPEWKSCLEYSNEDEVEPEWHHEANEHLGNVP